MVPEEKAMAADRRTEAHHLLQPGRGVHPAKAANATGIVTIGSDRASAIFGRRSGWRARNWLDLDFLRLEAISGSVDNPL
jgi:hypothetical protein